MIRNLAIAALRAAHRVKRSAALTIVPLILSLPFVGHFLCSALVGMFTCARAFYSFLIISKGNKGLLGLSLNQFLPLVYSRLRFYAELSRCHKSLLFLRRRSCCVMTYQGYLHLIQNGMPPPGGGTWVNFCWVCAAGPSALLPHYSLFCG